MSKIMNIESIVEFIQNETPENEELLISAYKSVKCLLNIEQECIDHRISELVLERDYDRVNDYVKMSKTVSEISSYINEWATKCGVNKNEIIGESVTDENEITNELPEDDMEINLTGEKRINYESFRVDENVAYNLMTDFRYMKPAAFSLDGVRYPARLWKLVLLKTCELLWEKNSNIFTEFVEDKFMQGKTRTYFSVDKSIMAKPELINGTEIFVETNLSANSIRDVIVKMLDKYRIPHAAYQIYLSKDLNPLHTEEYRYQDTGTEEMLTQDFETLDMQSICVDYDYKTEKCMNENSPYFIMECCKKESCAYITKAQRDRVIDKSTPEKVYVFSRKVLKKKICPECGHNMKGAMFSVEFESNNELKQNKLYGCCCKNCGRLYVTEGTYHSFVANKDLENIKVTFVIDEDKQLSLF